MAVPLLLILSATFLAVALIRFAVTLRDDQFLATTRQASKAAFGFGMVVSLMALPMIDLPTEPFLVPLGVLGLSGLFLAPPTRRYTFVVGAVAFLATLLAAGAYVFLGPPAGLLLGLPVALLIGHAPLPGRPSLRFLAAIPLGLGLAWWLGTVATPLLLAPAAVLFFGLPHGAPYPVIEDEAPWDQKMLYYLALVGVAIAAMLSLNAGAGGPLQDPAIDQAQVTLALIGSGILLVFVFKAAFGAVRRFVTSDAEA